MDDESKKREHLRAFAVLILVVISVLWCHLAPSQRAAAEIARGDVRYIQKRFAEAQLHYFRALELTPEDFRPYQRLARCRQLSEVTFESAKGYYKRALERAPEDLETLLCYAQYLERESTPEEARRILFRVLSLEPGCLEALMRLAKIEIQDGRHARGRAWYGRILELAPGYYLAEHGLAKLAHDQGELEEALRHYYATLGASPYWDHQALVGITAVLLELKRPKELETLIAKLARRRAIHQRDAAAHLVILGTHYLKSENDLDRARESFLQAIEYSEVGRSAEVARQYLAVLNQ